MASTFLLLTLVGLGGFFWAATRKMLQRLETLEQGSRRLSESMIQMAEIQLKAHLKATARIEEMEERIMELSVPSHDSSMPLERRHQVLSLARQGVGIEEIVKRLKAPVGEAELILNLSRFMGNEIPPPAQSTAHARHHA